MVQVTNSFYFCLTHVCYWIGHGTWLIIDYINRVSPADEGIISCLYPIYSKFLNWSADFDEKDWIWLSRQPTETEEEYTRRCELRWPEEK